MSSNPPVPPLPDTQSLYAMDTRSLRGTPDGRRSIDNRSIAENGSIINGNGGYASSFTGVPMAELYGNQIPVQPVQPVAVPIPQPVPQPQIQPQAQPAPANPQNWDSDFSQFMSQAAAEHLPPPLYHNAVHDAPYHLNQS
ncbi:hypothetical protein BT69DRAFT_87131 [Atractiella rhizophila]|nr:hypothetical protein BT69DRAFT_87131 [Atractiella rhizophila]